jgi:tripartite-type tricarboxylate transporter receptor subunit TctC
MSILSARSLMVLGVIFSCVLLTTQRPKAEDYPSRPIKLQVGASPGGTTDTVARALAEPMASALRQPVVVENRPGAGGNLAADAVAKSTPDGHTLLVSFTSHTINATLYPKLPFDPVADFTPITMVATVPSLLVGHPKVPANDLESLIALAKSQPDTLTIGIGGNVARANRFARRTDQSDVHQLGHGDGTRSRRKAARLRCHQCSKAAIIS